jgi:regulation of enolase protein 1 (concanavalin A-like superfamily)
MLKMKRFCLTILMLGFIGGKARASEVLFQDDFKGKLGEGWSWVREHREAWRTTPSGLEVQIEPGNMWGPQNNAKNLLVRDAPAVTNGLIEISVGIENKPTHQYEQVDLVWHYNDSNMVKLGQELVDGKLSIVMGREENDKTRTVAIIPLESTTVRVKFLVEGSQIRGQFQIGSAKEWQQVGECSLPTPENARAKISLQFYQGPEKEAHWARVSEFRISRVSEK